MIGESAERAGESTGLSPQSGPTETPGKTPPGIDQKIQGPDFHSKDDRRQDPDRPFSTRRQYHRWRVSVPCRFEWQGQIRTGMLSELSFGGGRILFGDNVPDEGTVFTVKLTHGKHRFSLQAEVVYKWWDVHDSRHVGSMGVKWSEADHDRGRKLTTLFQRLELDH